MSIALVIQGRDVSTLQQGIEKQLPEVNVQVWPELDDVSKIEFVIAWKCPDNLLSQFPNLKAVCSLGAGVDGLLALPDLPVVPICRIVEQDLAKQMSDYVLAQLLSFQYRLHQYTQQQQDALWAEQSDRMVKSVTVLGIGLLGHQVASCLLQHGYRVTGWSRTKKTGRDYPCLHGSETLVQAVADADCVVSILPATTETDNLFGRSFFQQMKPSALFINVGRGNTVVEDDLLYALQHNVITGACLDVFKTEPLPENHPFWQLKNLVITPHIAAVTRQQNIIDQIVEHFRNLQHGQPLSNQVNIQQGY
ncbi:2-hydroxyacid dehydrogenase [Thalassotalea mangrovi]|uniref:Glyoxylate/hydroxypyruvate reductase A n=1 Tax=Thalassotalea mangrovi TaxID=2572245 RepID=A0A4U1B4I8_9GAMM|nr:glyoxylate/hydroxypyruvate reductase A [Thalassotalea mangrovi]TKB45154.1 glyoxylate/hydroxypyruvate reductase A [Thalassotalea mangrovi]